ncbi:MAG: intradiol ring-cleavage dioxygenase [Alphaproteobacteria bacterium]|uniref:Intradiol ring-cleavage dioxygenase n=1 Tax=Candidatus Nitrobium versatile TaxID=2884831 RepID=A0A953J9Q3_9BACT|nr:intradiol ring-cleavage dioxygenase [Candidatus Nitrobium versatile]
MKGFFSSLPFAFSLLAAPVLLVAVLPQPGGAAQCAPTEPDMLGPFYKPDAPVRSRVGQGYILGGVVRSSHDCSPVAQARIEVWLAGPEGEYDDAHRATLFSDAKGVYRFESNFPPPYSGRPPHIHLRVSAAGYRTLVTQHYPVKGQSQGTMDLVLVPVRP